MRKTKNHMMKR